MSTLIFLLFVCMFNESLVCVWDIKLKNKWKFRLHRKCVSGTRNSIFFLLFLFLFFGVWLEPSFTLNKLINICQNIVSGHFSHCLHFKNVGKSWAKEKQKKFNMTTKKK